MANPAFCPDCKKQMVLQHAWRDDAHENVRHMLYICDCGRSSDQLVAGPSQANLNRRSLDSAAATIARSQEHMNAIRYNRAQYSVSMVRSQKMVADSVRVLRGG